MLNDFFDPLLYLPRIFGYLFLMILFAEVLL